MFYVPIYFSDPISLLLTPYAGYLHVGTRLVFYLERLVDPRYAPAVGAVISLLVTVSVAVFLASDRLGNVLAHRWQRLSFAAALLLAPSAYETLGIDIAIQSYLGVYLVALAVARPPRTKLGRAVDALGAAIAGLSGPFAVLLAPLFWFGRRSWLTVIVTSCGIVQLVVLLVAPRRPWNLPDLATLAEIAALRLNAAVLGSSLGTLAPAIVGAALGATLMLLAVRTWPAGSAFGYGALVAAGGGIAVTGPALADSAFAGERYFLLAGLTAALIIISGAAAEDHVTRLIARSLSVLLVIGFAVDFQVSAFPERGWEEASACIGALEPCRVEVYPERFSFVWPGAAGDYETPMLGPPAR